ncbi:MAG: hypothetical protein EOP38_11440 [Rubrivivax sp.]|nr:MAG: hypothetical protein EOP38_11440 [Rubrivivax sp.]
MSGHRAGLLTTISCSGAVVLCVGLAGCASDQSAAYQVARSLVRPNADIDARPLDTNLRYLRVTANGKAALMALGYTDASPQGAPVQVWYSAMGEVLRLQQGRLKGLTGAPVEWRTVTWPGGLPAWPEVLSHGADGPAYRRQRDEMPGYRLDLRDTLRLQPVPAPGGTELTGVPAASLRWFQETPSDGALPPARYAVDAETAEPVYGEQCLNADLCLTWQAWPPLRGGAR